MSDSATKKRTAAEISAARHPRGPRRRLPVNQQSRLVPAKQAAELVGVAYGTLRDLARRGQIPFVKFGDGKRAHWFFKRSDLDALIERHTERAC